MSREQRLEGDQKDAIVAVINQLLFNKSGELKVTELLPYLETLVVGLDRSNFDALMAEDEIVRLKLQLKVRDQTIEKYQKELDALGKRLENICMGVTNAILAAYDRGTSPETLARIMDESRRKAQEAQARLNVQQKGISIVDPTRADKIIPFPNREV